MPIRKGNHSKRRYMYFHSSSKRDPAISQEEESRRYNMVICEYCQECMDEYALSKGKVPRRIGVCGICGKDGILTGSLYQRDKAIVTAKMIYRNRKEKEVKNG